MLMLLLILGPNLMLKTVSGGTDDDDGGTSVFQLLKLLKLMSGG